MTLYNTTNAEITYNPNSNVLTQTIKGYLDSAALQAFQQELIRICRRNGISKIIADTKKQKVLKQEDMEWMISQVIPSLIQCKVRQFALVMPENPFGQLAVEKFTEAAAPLQVKIFPDYKSSHSWICSELN